MKLLLIGASGGRDDIFSMMNHILRNFPEIKILLYTRENLERKNEISFLKERVRIISGKKGAFRFFEALEELLPDHRNHSPKNDMDYENQHEVSTDAFEKIRNNRKKVFILKCIEDGLYPKEMSDKVGLKVTTINAYIERMMEETGCRTQTVLVLQSKKRGII